MKIEEELNIAKKQSKQERYDYILKNLPLVDYIIELEKYILKEEKKES